MPAPDTPLTGDALLAAVTDARIALHKSYTDVEKALIELQRATTVQETGSAFQTAMQPKFIAAVEHPSGRDVLAFISYLHVGPTSKSNSSYSTQVQPDRQVAARLTLMDPRPFRVVRRDRPAAVTRTEIDTTQPSDKFGATSARTALPALPVNAGARTASPATTAWDDERASSVAPPSLPLSRKTIRSGSRGGITNAFPHPRHLVCSTTMGMALVIGSDVRTFVARSGFGSSSGA